MQDLTIEEKQERAKMTKVYHNAVVVSNIIEVVTGVIARVAGKDIADSVGEESLSRNLLSAMVATRIKEKLSK